MEKISYLLLTVQITVKTCNKCICVHFCDVFVRKKLFHLDFCAFSPHKFYFQKGTAVGKCEELCFQTFYNKNNIGKTMYVCT